MPTKFIALPITVERVFTCKNCGWFRELVAHPAYRFLMYNHGVYGVVTYEKAASLDILYHKCAEHRSALERLPSTWRRYIDLRKVQSG